MSKSENATNRGMFVQKINNKMKAQVSFLGLADLTCCFSSLLYPLLTKPSYVTLSRNGSPYVLYIRAHDNGRSQDIF